MAETASVTNRLAQQYPVLAAQLSSLTAERQEAVAMGVAQAALRLSGVATPSCEPSALAAQVVSLDEAAWDLQDSGSEEYASAFARARAVNALMLAIQGQPDEAVYEAVAALGRQTEVLATINAG
jgi:hypothetical protein